MLPVCVSPPAALMKMRDSGEAGELLAALCPHPVWLSFQEGTPGRVLVFREGTTLI